MYVNLGPKLKSAKLVFTLFVTIYYHKFICVAAIKSYLRKCFGELCFYPLQFQNTREKLADITSSIISAVNSRCQCSLTANHISTAHFVCTSDRQVVLYRAELFGHKDCVQVLSYIEQWVRQNQTSVIVQGNSMKVYPNCPIEINSLTSETGCVRPTTAGPPSGSFQTTEAVAGGVGGVLSIGIIILAAVVACMCVSRHRNKQR